MPTEQAWSEPSAGAAGADALFLPDRALVVYARSGAAPEVLDGALSRWGLPGGKPTAVRVAAPDGDSVRVEARPARAVALADALPVLLATPVDDRPAYRRPPDSLRAWALAARLALRLVAARAVVPDLTPADEGTVHGVWRVWLGGGGELAAASGWLAAAMPPAAHALAHEAGGVWTARALLERFLDAVADHAVRAANPPPAGTRPRARLLPWTVRWAEALTDRSDPSVPLRDDVDETVAAVAGWRSAGAGELEEAAPVLRLRAPAAQDGPWQLDLGLRTGDDGWTPAGDVWAGQTQVRQESLLRGLGRCARVFPPLDAALRTPAPEQVTLDLEEAWTLLEDAAPALARVGAELELPDDLARHDLRVRLRVDAPDTPGEPAAAGEDAPDGAAGAGGPFGGLVAGLSWEVALGDEPLSEEEIDALLDVAAPLVRWRDRWVRVDEDGLRAVRERRLPDLRDEVPLPQALALALAGSTTAGTVESVPEGVDVVAGGSVAALLDRLADAASAPPAPTTPSGFAGELRPYQRRGVAWLDGMGALGLGAVLADDMGLGKGIQLIAYLLSRGPGPHLVVCPTSVVGNWHRELARFAPGLQVARFHGPDRPRRLDGTDGVVLTSYGTLRRDPDPLLAVNWDVVTLDEAQHVKNPATAGARAVRRLHRRQTVALTGTPLENRLGELWALLDVTNPGLLGGRAAFARRFVVPIEKRSDARVAARLRRLVAPFVLRREKSDPAVVADLPPKIERTVVCALTPEQAQLYRACVQRAFGDGPGGLAGASTMERRGRVLALLTALKQVCNHPAQLLGEADPAIPGRSGKLAAARELLAEVVEAGERALVFTQYVAMGRLLVAQLGADLDVDVPFLHGGVPAASRDRMVAAFQEDPDAAPVLVVSLRAGGTGLNLTAATHVLHYDRWWNPAVEDQATDRAHRIGQRRTVEVHKLVTAGTVEERIAEVIERKRALSAHVVGAGEAWITELGDDEIAELVALAPDATIDELDEDWTPLDVEEAS